MRGRRGGGEFINARHYQGVVSRLLANGMNPKALRSNAVLRKQEWEALDATIVPVARNRMVGIGDLINAGLRYDIPNGLGTMVFQYETASDMEPAFLSMDAGTGGDNDRVKFELGSLPMPITARPFKINARVLEASRKIGAPLDTTQAETAAIKVAELNEQVLFQGANSLTFGGGTLYGYTDFPSRNTYSIAAAWTQSGVTGKDIVDDVRAMKQKSIDDLHHGPWMLYIPKNWETVLDDDFSTAKGEDTIRARIKKIDGIQDVKVADFLTNSNVVLVEMQARTARAVIGMQPTNVEWQEKGGLIMEFLVMDIIVPQLRADQNGNCGIVHGSV